MIDDPWERGNAFLSGRGGTLEAFREDAARLFSRMAEGRPPTPRRPNVSLRLIASGEPAAKLTVLPRWRRGRRFPPTAGSLDCERMAVEMLTERAVRVEEGDAKNWSRSVGFELSPGESRVVRLCRETVFDDLGRAVGVMDDFLHDRRAVFARSHDHCCVCGRHLTDEQSRARGIGPECVRWVHLALFLGPNVLVSAAEGETRM
jgi:hypothetical protein